MVDEHNTVVAPECSSRVHIVKAEWFWASVQNEEAQDERDYLFKDVSKINIFSLSFYNHTLKWKSDKVLLLIVFGRNVTAIVSGGRDGGHGHDRGERTECRPRGEHGRQHARAAAAPAQAEVAWRRFRAAQATLLCRRCCTTQSLRKPTGLHTFAWWQAATWRLVSHLCQNVLWIFQCLQKQYALRQICTLLTNEIKCSNILTLNETCCCFANAGDLESINYKKSTIHEKCAIHVRVNIYSEKTVRNRL